MEHSSSQGYSQSQRSEETVEMKAFSPITELKYHLNGQNRIRNIKTVFFPDIENEKKKSPNKSSPQFISSDFLNYFKKFGKDEKWCSEEMKVEEEMENNYIENISYGHKSIKTTIKVEQSNNRTKMIKVEESQSSHRSILREVRISSEITDIHSNVHLRPSVQDKRKLKIRSSTGELYRSRSLNRKPDKMATSQDDELLDVYSSSFASDFMC